jgi:HEAT repeat protein
MRVLLSLSLLVLVACSSAQPGEKTTDAYIADLGSPDPALQLDACKKLGARRAKNAVPKIGALLSNSGDPEVQAAAAASLGEIAEPGSTGVLLQKFESTQVAPVQYAIMAALGNLQLVNGNASNKAAVVQAANRAKESKDPILQDLASRVILIYDKK